jgi:hypothetical protein
MESRKIVFVIVCCVSDAESRESSVAVQPVVEGRIQRISRGGGRPPVRARRRCIGTHPSAAIRRTLQASANPMSLFQRFVRKFRKHWQRIIEWMKEEIPNPNVSDMPSFRSDYFENLDVYGK